MSGKWRQLGYVELYAGPGRLLDQSTGMELPGSPIEALRVPANHRQMCGHVAADYRETGFRPQWTGAAIGPRDSSSISDR